MDTGNLRVEEKKRRNYRFKYSTNIIIKTNN